MKVGQLEGTPEEIKNLVENHGLNLNDYLIKPDKPICLKWVIAPSIGFSISLICTYIFGTSSEDEFIGNLFFLLTMGLALWLTVVIQIRHKNIWASSLSIFVLLLLSLVSLGVMQPYDLIIYIEKLRNEQG
ncbi:hypothetical protein [Photobacterium phosphoreum]|uniref:hypothetical protein n=1 Tax=Photobacterium phosphoreum TaxID=659 RepID=UPI000CF3C105|nr:hypothetical protein [Photobacterium phosphoreum]PQJ85892.1 hypothetical protein BTO21_13725 [Photobacterium phosphoreum]PSV70979.1 hypothetical protein CTM77_10040 [Photobacterium phosphoreum]